MSDETKCKILWVQDEHDGPLNGLALYKNQKVWFARIPEQRDIDAVIAPKSVSDETASTEKKTDEELLEIDVDNWDLPDDEDEDTETEMILFRGKMDKRQYRLLRLSEQDLLAVTDNHINYCRETGAPVIHGAPRVVKIKKEKGPDNNQETAVKEEGKSEKKVSNEFTHAIVSFNITGAHVATIKQSDFANYWVEHEVITEVM